MATTVTNGWDLVGGLNQDILNELVNSAFNNGLNSGGIQPIPGTSYTITPKGIDVVICPSPDLDTGWTNCIDAQIQMNVTGTGVDGTATMDLKVNPMKLNIGFVSQGTYLTSGGIEGSYANCGNLPASLQSTGCTFMAWVQGQTAAQQTVISLVDSSNTSQLEVLLTGSILTLTYLGNPYSIASPTVTPDLTTGWHHIAVVIDETSVTFFIDGQPQGATVTIPSPSFAGFGTSYEIQAGGSASGTFDGNLTGLSIWTSPLSAAQVQRFMNANLAATGLNSAPDSIGYWLFDPANPVNLLTDTQVEAESSAQFQTASAPMSQTFIYFASDSAANILNGVISSTDLSSSVVNALNSQVPTYLNNIVTSGAIAPNPQQQQSGTTATPTFIKLITEANNSTPDWSGPSQLLMLSMINNNIPPAPTTSDYQTDFATETAVEIPSGSNLVMAAEDYFLLSQLQPKLIEQDWTPTLTTGSPPQLTATNNATMGKHGKIQPEDLKITVFFVNQEGISLTVVYDGLSAINFDISTTVTLKLTTTSTGSTITLSTTDTDVDVVWNQSNPGVISMEILTALLILTPCAIVAECLLSVFLTIQLIVQEAIYSKIKGLGRSFEVSQNLTSLLIDDGIVVTGVLVPPGPLVTAISPQKGSPEAIVTIAGAGFIDTSGNSLIEKVSIGGQLVVDFTEPQGTFENATTEATVALGGTGIGTPVKVKGTTGYWSNPFGSFVVTGTVAPSQVTLVDSSGLAGETIGISGSGFTGTTDVLFGTSSAKSFTVISDTSLTAVVPAGISDAVTVNVANNKGSADSTNQFTPTPVPTITSISGPGGSDYACMGDTVTIQGTDFGEAGSTDTFVQFTSGYTSNQTALKTNQVPAIVLSSNSITVQVPSSAMTGPLWVTTSAGTSTASESFSIFNQHAPSNITFNESMGTTGTQFTVYGDNFTGATAVTIGGQFPQLQIFQLVSDTQINVTVVDQTQTGVITVFNDSTAGESQSGSSADTFTMIPSPHLNTNAITPSSGNVGTLVTITGTNFWVNGQSVLTAVNFGTTPSTDAVATSDTSITASVPEGVSGGQTGSVSIGVTTPGGSATSTSRFTISNDNLTLVEGIGPKIHALLNQHGIFSFEQLSDTTVDKLREIFRDEGLKSRNPGTWPAQANLAYNGEMEALKSIKAYLKGGVAP